MKGSICFEGQANARMYLLMCKTFACAALLLQCEGNTMSPVMASTLGIFIVGDVGAVDGR
jgi:hypothetical protein